MWAREHRGRNFRTATEALEGPWYISAGLNKAFDTFDCQLHKFEAPTPTKLVGNLQVLASRAICPSDAGLGGSLGAPPQCFAPCVPRLRTR